MNTWNTSYTLIKRACDPNDEDSWQEFVNRYQRFIYHILCHMGIQQSDAPDLTQDILLTLWQKMPQYDKGKAGFRTWLRTIIRNAALAYIRKQEKRIHRETESAGNRLILGGVPVANSDLDHIIEKEWAAHVTNIAMERAREAFQGKAIEVFELSRQGLDIEEISRRLGITKASAYSLRTRVKNCLLKEIQRLIKESELE